MSTQIQKIAAQVNELARSDPVAFAAAEAAYIERLRAAGCFFEGRVDPASLRPLPLSARDDAHIRRAATDLLIVLERLADLYRDDPAVREFFPAYLQAQHWLLADHGVRPTAGVCRLDGILAAGRFRIMEASTGGPGGVVKTGAELVVWREAIAEILGVAQPSYGDQPFAADRLMFVHHLINCHEKQFSVRPKCAAVVGLANEFAHEVSLIIEGLQQLGVAASHLDATELRRQPGRAPTAGGVQPTLTYNKLDQVKLINTPAARDYLDSMAKGELCMTPTLLAHCVLDDKSSLAFLTDPTFADSFTASERDTIARYVPWTRRVRAGRTTGPDGSTVDLLSYATEQQRFLVLKPNDRTRGEGVVIGIETPPQKWLAALGHAAQASNYVIQEYLEMPELEFPFGGPSALTRMNYGLDVYLFGGRFAGYLCRASVDAVINVGKRGILVPVAIDGEAK
jgi:hypothetical protein